MQPHDLETLPKLSGLFTLSLSLPLDANGAPFFGFPAAVAIPNLKEVVSKMPYCDLEIHGEPVVPANMLAGPL